MSICYAGASNVSSNKQREFVVDYLADLKRLPTTTRGALYPFNQQFPNPVPMGSKVYVIATGETYILSSDTLNWVQYMAGKVLEEPTEETPSIPGGSGGSGGSGGGSTPTPTGYTVYYGALPTKWTPEGDDTIDLVSDDITVEMITALGTMDNRTSLAWKGEAVLDPSSPSQWAYAYPKSFGSITSVMSSGLDNITNFVIKELTINDIEYYVYFTLGTAADTVEYDIK